MAKQVKVVELARTRALHLLRELLPRFDVHEEQAGARARWDLTIAVRSGRSTLRRLLVEFKSVGEPRYLAQAITRLGLVTRSVPRSYAVVAAPYIAPEGRRLCREAGVGYLDFAGNALLSFDGVYVERQSAERPARAKARLRRLFSPRSSRIARVLLEHRGADWTLVRLASEASVSLRTAHLVVKALDEKALVESRRGSIRLAKPGDLLDLWAESYRIDEHRRHTFYSFVRNSRDLAHRIAEQAERHDARVAFTLHSGAALVAPFVRSADVHAYVSGGIDRLAEVLDLRPTEAGGTVHLLAPRDEGVFYGVRRVDRIPVVCNTQLYLDLVHYPARGREQAAELRKRVLGF
jgi:hypothetical protein